MSFSSRGFDTHTLQTLRRNLELATHRHNAARQLADRYGSADPSHPCVLREAKRAHRYSVLMDKLEMAIVHLPVNPFPYQR